MKDMTIPEVLKDPLIGQLLRADKISLVSFAELLKDAAGRGEPPAANSRRLQRRSLSPRCNGQQSAA